MGPGRGASGGRAEPRSGRPISRSFGGAGRETGAARPGVDAAIDSPTIVGGPPATLRAFGRWCRARRLARGLTPTALGAPEFPAAAIRALERGAWRPSPLA